MAIEVSIIIPSYNRHPYNLLTLQALENQAFDLSKMEVILIDDASNDNTTQLKDYRPKYPFRYVRNKKNLGLSRTRNVGLARARGSIIILLDAEMLVEPDYVKKHYRHHQKRESVVVIGKNKNKAYSYLFPGFNATQLNEICSLAENSSAVRNRMEKRLKQNLQDINLAEYLKKLKKPVQLLDEKDVKSSSRLRTFSVPEPYSYNLLEQLEGRYENSRLTWLACFGSNLSFKKKVIDKIGGYDETFQGWGLEDTEFAYRLYRSGAQFVVDPTLSRYHQEHPITADRAQEEKRNMLLFQEKHPVIEVCIKSLNSLKVYDFRFMDAVLEEHYALGMSYPGQYEKLKQAILAMLKQIPLLITKKKPVTSLLQSSGTVIGSKEHKQIVSEREAMAASGTFANMVRLFDLLYEK